MSSMQKTDDVLEKVTKSLKLWKKLISDVCENDETKQNQLNILETHVKEYSELEHNFNTTSKAFQNLDEKLNSSEKIEDIESLYQDCVDNVTTGSSINHQKSRVWQTIFKGNADVREVHKKSKKLQDTQYDTIDESLLCSNVFVPPLDPISKTKVKNPYKSKKCGHIYEFDSIASYIRSQGKKAKCPYIGCNSEQLRMTDLVRDNELQSQISQYEETHVSEEEEEDSDDD
ncbi:E3 SUMO-protein ligase NSE2-like [Diabrotica virgifera virgifera]|uniref:E3 SUMO-protein ligase NSE2 n=1 Tax=Diabrotica virgifera virgifera TaxID=50390 RepID=A0ABM5JQN7_DIAVI|nr:E3 SUMO-protein ligase NSE2-like [Diabrotica virgifera virgifera]